MKVVKEDSGVNKYMGMPLIELESISNVFLVQLKFLNSMYSALVDVSKGGFASGMLVDVDSKINFLAKKINATEKEYYMVSRAMVSCVKDVSGFDFEVDRVMEIDKFLYDVHKRMEGKKLMDKMVMRGSDKLDT